MANPYPPNPGMQMQQPMQQHQQPMQQPPRGPNVARQGTSRAVPVVVSAGLAVGVFCGLLFGVGVPDDATASPSTGNNVKAADPAEPTPTPSTSASTATKPATPATATKPATPVAAGSGSAAPATTTTAAGTGAGSATATTKPAAGAGSGSATPTIAAPAVKKVKLVVEVKPDTVAATAKITIDKTEITGGMTELEIPSDGKKEVKVTVKASGYKTVEQKVEVEGDVTVKVELIKRTGGTGGGLPRPGTGGTKKKPPGGGLIDI